MSTLIIESVLLEYEGPQIVLAKDCQGAAFLGVAVPDGEDPHKFFGVRISDEALNAFQTGRIDLHFALTHARRPRRVTFSYDGLAKEVQLYIFKGNVPENWLPDRGLFLEPEAPAHSDLASVEIAIDGRWDIEDLADYPQKLSAPYGFLFALLNATRLGTNSISQAFQRYPWRGGYSTVMFFKDLYDAVPKGKRVVVKKMAYASPGAITLQAEEVVMAGLHASAARVNDKGAREAYRDLRRGMSNLKMLGRAPWEVNLDDAGQAFLSTHCRDLAEALAFPHLDRLHSLTGDSWHYTAKHLLSYFRRLDELSEFYESGKASYDLNPADAQSSPSTTTLGRQQFHPNL
ncbi:hypothetical protein [Ralstonia pseudosolanacearum]|uniref:hypothetical protein n=1 Tax=Ralstonia pseudosolanacearum TaxID=1310165 RepID=UPI003CF936CA